MKDYILGSNLSQEDKLKNAEHHLKGLIKTRESMENGLRGIDSLIRETAGRIVKMKSKSNETISPSPVSVVPKECTCQDVGTCDDALIGDECKSPNT